MPREILLIAHSDENGKLYDAKKNIFPKRTFHHLNQFVNHFILFSCHAEKVISYHELKKVFEKKTLTYPLVQDEFKTLFDEKTPLISVKSMLNLSYFMQNENNRSEVCDVKINSSSKEINLIISLNDFIIGSMHDESRKIFQTDCKMIGDKNTVKIFQPTSAKKMRLNITEITVSRNNEETQLDIKEFISKINQHHILTIGTTGGIP
jgi:phosphoribosylformylglycinamidine (FGAM) synthase-like amidotransferase family enzyme